MADESQFQELLAAYRLLNSPLKRANYDTQLSSARSATSGSLLQGLRKLFDARWRWLKTSFRLGSVLLRCGADRLVVDRRQYRTGFSNHPAGKTSAKGWRLDSRLKPHVVSSAKRALSGKRIGWVREEGSTVYEQTATIRR